MLNMPAHSHSNKSLPNLLDWIKTTITVNYFTLCLVAIMLLRDDQTCTTSTNVTMLDDNYICKSKRARLEVIIN